MDNVVCVSRHFRFTMKALYGGQTMGIPACASDWTSDRHDVVEKYVLLGVPKKEQAAHPLSQPDLL